MATSADKLKTELKRVEDAAVHFDWQDTITSIATPEPSLRTELGPLTTKLEKAKTRQCAAVLAVEFAARADFQHHLRTLRVTFAEATLHSGNGGSEALSNLMDVITDLKVAVAISGKAELSKKPPPSPLVKVLDALLVQSLMAVPFAGPFLAGAAQSAGALLGAAVTTGFQSIANYALTPPPEDKSTLAKVLGVTTQWDGIPSAIVSGDGKVVAGAVSKAVSPGEGGGAVSFFYDMWKKSQDAKRKEALNQLVAAGNLEQHIGLVKVMNAQTQNQIACNALYDRLFGSVRPVEEEKKLEHYLNNKSDTIADFFNKVPKAIETYRAYVLKLMYASIVNSLAPDIAALETEIVRLTAGNVTARPHFLSAMSESKTELAVVLVMGYYFHRYMKNNPAHRAHFVTLMRKHYGEAWSIEAGGGGHGALTTMLPDLNPESTQIIKTFKEVQKFKSVMPPPPGPPSGFARPLHWIKGSDHNEPIICDVIGTAGTNAAIYLTNLKASVSNTLAKNIERGSANRAYIEDIVRLVAVCSLIVNEVLASVALKKSFSYQDSWIDVLADLDFVARYSKWLGQISEEKKKLVTGVTSANPEDYRLRFPHTLPSDSERTMVYMFASIVVLNVDLGRIATGNQNWEKVRGHLYKIIGTINRAEL